MLCLFQPSLAKVVEWWSDPPLPISVLRFQVVRVWSIFGNTHPINSVAMATVGIASNIAISMAQEMNAGGVC